MDGVAVSIGQALRAARVDAGMTEEQVADATRLRKTLVKAIENDDYALCGGDVYARGHIRTMARVVGLDPEPLMAQFSAERSPHRLTTPADAFDPRVSSAASRRRPLNWSAAMLAVLLLLVVYGGVRLVHGKSSPPAALGEELPLAGVTSSLAPVVPSPPAVKPPVKTRPPARPTTVQVRLAAANGASWVRATGHDGRRIWEGTVSKGSTRAFSDTTQLSLVIGNAGAVTLQVNGRSIGSPGSRGEVATVSYTRNDPA